MMSDMCALCGKTRSGVLCYQCCVLDPEKRGTFADVAEALREKRVHLCSVHADVTEGLQAAVDEAEALG